jgi:hypothetical protein
MGFDNQAKLAVQRQMVESFLLVVVEDLFEELQQVFWFA